MPVKKKKIDALLLVAIITTALGLLGGLAFANLSYINFSSGKNAGSFNFLNERFGTSPSIKSLLEQITQDWSMMLAAFAVLSIMIGAFMYVSSSANEELSKQAKQFIGLTLIGLIFASLAYLIVKLVVGAFY